MVEHAALEGQGGFRMQLWDKGTGGLLQRSSAGRCVGSAGGPGFHGRVAVKLMHRESRNGDEENKYTDTKWGRGVGGIGRLGLTEIHY